MGGRAARPRRRSPRSKDGAARGSARRRLRCCVWTPRNSALSMAIGHRITGPYSTAPPAVRPGQSLLCGSTDGTVALSRPVSGNDRRFGPGHGSPKATGDIRRAASLRQSQPAITHSTSDPWLTRGTTSSEQQLSGPPRAGQDRSMFLCRQLALASRPPSGRKSGEEAAAQRDHRGPKAAAKGR